MAAARAVVEKLRGAGVAPDLNPLALLAEAAVRFAIA